MAIVVHWLPEHGVSMSILSGRMTPDAILEHARNIDPDGPASAGRWIRWFDDDLDMSELDLDVIVELSALASAKAPQGPGGRRMRSVIVCSSRLNQSYCDLWRGYIRSDPGHPVESATVKTLKQACERLELDEPARCALEAILADRRRARAA